KDEGVLWLKRLRLRTEKLRSSKFFCPAPLRSAQEVWRTREKAKTRRSFFLISATQITGDDETLDLASPFADAEQGSITVEPLDRILLHEAVTAEGLLALARAVFRDFRTVELRHGRLLLEGEAFLFHPRSFVKQGL